MIEKVSFGLAPKRRLRMCMDLRRGGGIYIDPKYCPISLKFELKDSTCNPVQSPGSMSLKKLSESIKKKKIAQIMKLLISICTNQ